MESTPDENVTTIPLNDEWRMHCQHDDTNLKVRVYQLDQKTEWIGDYSEVPAKVQSLADNFSELFELLTASKGGLKFQKPNLMIECLIGVKTKTIEIELQEKNTSIYSQLQNTQVMYNEKCEELQQFRKKSELQIVTLHQKLKQQQLKVKQLICEKQTQKQRLNIYQSLVQRFRKYGDFQQCSKWGCEEILFVPKHNAKKAQQARYGYRCDRQECKY